MDLIDIKECCRMRGGSRPCHPCTIYRDIKRKLWPKPVRIVGTSRWLRSECLEALRSMVEARQ